MQRKLTIEVIAIRAVLELPDSPSPEAAERADEFTIDVLRAFRPLAKTRPIDQSAPMRRMGSR